MRASKIKQEYAFTLIELLCVIALLGMITMLATPAISNLGRSRDLESAARTLATDLRKAQHKAIMVGQNQRVNFRYDINDNNQYTITDTSTGETEHLFFPEGITYRAVTFPIIERYRGVAFKYTGVTYPGGTVWLTNSAGDGLYVIVTPVTGRVRISDKSPDD